MLGGTTIGGIGVGGHGGNFGGVKIGGIGGLSGGEYGGVYDGVKAGEKPPAGITNPPFPSPLLPQGCGKRIGGNSPDGGPDAIGGVVIDPPPPCPMIKSPCATQARTAPAAMVGMPVTSAAGNKCHSQKHLI